MSWRNVARGAQRHGPGLVAGLLAGLGLPEFAEPAANLLAAILSVL
jgi:hypothetical protein